METNNKLREAVVLALSLLDLEEGVPSKTVSQKDIDFMKAALAEPVKNCEVGTVETKLSRMSAWCRAHQDTGEIIHCRRCPIKSDNYFLCALRWAQMPYEERGDK